MVGSECGVKWLVSGELWVVCDGWCAVGGAW